MMVVPEARQGRISAVRPIRFRDSMGQAWDPSWGTQPTEKEVDGLLSKIDRTYGSGEFSSFKDWTRDDALMTFNLVNYILAFREKLLLASAVSRVIVKRPDVAGAVLGTEYGGDFVKALDGMAKTLGMLSEPNFLNTLKNLLHALEINVLPKMFGLAVRGYRPIFRNNTLDKVYTNTSSSATTDVVDFGDIAATKLSQDFDFINLSLDAIMGSMKRYTEGATLGAGPAAVPLILKVILWATTAIIAIMVTARILFGNVVTKIFMGPASILENPEVRAILDKLAQMDPAMVKEFIENLSKMADIWGAFASAVKWIVGGIVATVVVVGVVILAS